VRGITITAGVGLGSTFVGWGVGSGARAVGTGDATTVGTSLLATRVAVDEAATTTVRRGVPPKGVARGMGDRCSGCPQPTRTTTTNASHR
jgi:hypothetical protein